TGAPVEWVEEPSYFFRLSKWQQPLLDLYAARPDFIAPDSRRNEVISFVKGGLTDLSISRTTFSWGVPVPGDEDHVMYVWLDALTNYITAVGFPDQTGDYARYWPANLHMVGKDILRFHTVYWPAFLMAAGLEVPGRVFAHGWWTNEGQKISKSVGNVIDPRALIETYGLDPVRYFLLREVPFGNDGDFSHRAMINRMNGELANDLGNLAQRVLSMIAKNCAGAVPEPGPFSEDDDALLAAAVALLDKVRQAMDRQAFHEALEAIWVVIRAANGYVDRQAPWALRKNDPPRMATVLYVLAEVIRRVALLMQPFVPASAARMLDQLGQGPEARDTTALGDRPLLAPGTVLPKPEGIFPRHVVDDEGAA
ncbi:MAG TPA: methionine--tRNA ligase, partial [Rhodospirillum rubrum]|nr:methionine--tRNA ligase [Rhodospirillum rubrum]